MQGGKARQREDRPGHAQAQREVQPEVQEGEDRGADYRERAERQGEQPQDPRDNLTALPR